LSGVAEPTIHFCVPPAGGGGTRAAAREALVITLYHWGLHGWAVYAAGGLVLAYFHYCRGASFMPSASLRAVFTGSWIKPVAYVADLIAVLAVAFGVAAAIALGVLQFESGLRAAGLVSADSAWVRGLILIVLCGCYLASASTGLHQGIKWLSQINVVLAIVLLVFVLLVGPTSTLLGDFGNGIIDYARALPKLMTSIHPFTDKDSWLHGWSVSYFVWWIAWTPFVGIFIARISRGRTIREFMIGVVGAPVLFCILWFAVFGGAAIFEDTHGGGGIAQLVNEDNTVALFALLGRYPLAPILMGVALGLVFVFLVTSVDSATYVLGMLTAQGSNDPPTRRKLSWGFSLAVLGGAMMAVGKMDVVRSSALLGAIPFVLIIQFQVVALIRDLRSARAADKT
ncbi:MAG: BCCT family transporter, partial [Myxococcota bacterium]